MGNRKTLSLPRLMGFVDSSKYGTKGSTAQVIELPRHVSNHTMNTSDPTPAQAESPASAPAPVTATPATPPASFPNPTNTGTSTRGYLGYSGTHHAVTPTPAATPAPAPAGPSMREVAQSMVPFKVLDPFVSCLVEPHQFQDALASDYNDIFIYSNGEVYQHTKLTGGRFVRIKVEGLPSRFKEVIKDVKVTTIKEEFNFLPAGKIPYAYWQQIVSFFRQVSKTMRSEVEAHAWILWEKERGYFISVPKQTVSKASVSFSYDAEGLPPGSVIVVDLHSHNTMGAFFSGTDDNNDKNSICYSGVIGKISDSSYDWIMRFNLHNTKRNGIKLDEIFAPQDVAEVPQAWMDQIQQTSTPSYGQWVGGGAWSGSYQGGKNWGSDQRGNGVGSSPNNPAKWSASHSASNVTQSTGHPSQADFYRSQGHQGRYPNSPELWEDDLYGYGYTGNVRQLPDPTPAPVAGYDSERQIFRGTKNLTPEEAKKQKDDLEALMKDLPAPPVNIEALDAATTEWLRRAGFNEDGTPPASAAAPAAPSPEEESTDPVGQIHPVVNAIHQRVLDENGKEAGDAYELIDTAIVSLEKSDEALMDIAKQCYNLMSSEGRSKLETNGF